MQDTLQYHIQFLEQQIRGLSGRLTKSELATGERDSIENEIQLAWSALDHYRQAFLLELRLKNKPSKQFGAESVC